MECAMKSRDAVELAGELFGEGYHCAEAVVAAVFESLDLESEEVVRLASPFGGGFGQSFTEACGVVAGSLLVVGYLHGRKARGESWQTAATLAEKVRRAIEERYTTCNCGILREQFGSEKQMDKCRELVRFGTASLLKTLRDYDERQRDSAETPCP